MQVNLSALETSSDARVSGHTQEETVPLILIPTRTKWKAFKKKYDVPDGAVSGIDLGKALDTYENEVKSGIRFALANAAAAEKLEKVLYSYISKMDKKKIKNFAKFQQEFLDDYLGASKAKAEDFKRYSADRETYKKEVLSFVSMAQRFPPNATTAEDLQKFKSGPLRGLSAVGSGLRDAGVDTGPIDKLAASMQKVIDAAQNADAPTIERVRASIVNAAAKIGEEAKGQGLI